jgi:hypothetical protein
MTLSLYFFGASRLSWLKLQNNYHEGPKTRRNTKKLRAQTPGGSKLPRIKTQAGLRTAKEPHLLGKILVHG